MNRYLPIVTFLGIVTTVTLQTQPVFALESSEIASITKAFTVQINGEQTGTGTIIENNGDTYRILTCWHVVDLQGQYEIVTSDGKTHKVTQIYNLPGVDLAVVEFNSKNSYQFAEFGNVEKTNPGNNLYTAGYPDPFPGFPERSYAFLNIAIISKQSKGRSGYQIIYSNPTPPGGSGGGIFDSDARLIGVNGRVISEGNTSNTYGAGIPLEVYLASRDSLVISSGQKKFRAKDYDGAIAELDRVIASNPDLGEAYVERAVIYYQLGNYADAIDDLNFALKQNSESAKAYSYRGLIYSSLGEHEQAFEDHERAISLNPDLDTVYANRGASYVERHNESQEEEDIQNAFLDAAEAIRINPDYASAYIGQDNVLRLIKRLKSFQVTNNLEIELKPRLIPSKMEVPNFITTLADKITSNSRTQEKQIETLLALGEALRSMELYNVSREFLEIALSLTEDAQSLNEEKFDVLMSLGKSEEAIYKEELTQFSSQTIALDNLANAGGSAESALSTAQPAISYYKQAAESTTFKSNIAQAQLAHLKILIDSKLFWQQATREVDKNLDSLEISEPDFLAQVKDNLPRLQRELSNELEPKIAKLTQNLQSEINDASIYLLIDLASSLISIDRYDLKTIKILNTAINKAQQLNNIEAEAEATSHLAYLQEQKKEYAKAKELTTKGLQIISQAENPRISSILYAQQARRLINEGKTEAALTAYENSFTDIQTFADRFTNKEIESIAQNYISFLLSSNPSQAELQKTLEIWKFTKIKRIEENFNLAIRQKENLIPIAQAYPDTAVVHPILTENSLDVIYSFPGESLRHYTTKNVNKAQIDNIIKQLRRRSLTNLGFAEAIRSEQNNPQAIAKLQNAQNESLQQDIIPLASELYRLLIQPAEANLTTTEIKNLVFVVDGSLQNIPMSILYDENRREYLIEKYNIAYSYNSQVTDPELAQNNQISVLAAGTTRDFPAYRFPPTPKVEDELKAIKQIFPESTILLNEAFTFESLEQELQKSNHSVVHIATHGQFGSTSNQNFVLSGKFENPIINLNHLVDLLQTVNFKRSTPIEMLVLSAGYTALGYAQALDNLVAKYTSTNRIAVTTTLGTLWGLNDEALSILMQKFYANLGANAEVSKFEALRNAQLTLLKDSRSRYSHPYYWAAPILILN